MTFLFPDSEKHKYDHIFKNICFKIQSIDIVCWKEELETPGRSDGKQMTYQFLQKRSQVLSSGLQAHPHPQTHPLLFCALPCSDNTRNEVVQTQVSQSSDHVINVTSSFLLYKSVLESPLPGDFCALSLVAAYHIYLHIIPKRSKPHSYYIIKHRNHVSFLFLASLSSLGCSGVFGEVLLNSTTLLGLQFSYGYNKVNFR